MAHNAGPLDNVPAGHAVSRRCRVLCRRIFTSCGKPGGGWKKASDSIDYNDEWQVLNRNPFAWDIAQEDPNTSFDPVGQTENLDYPKWSGIRHPGQDVALSRQRSAWRDGCRTAWFSIRSPTRSRMWMQTATGASTGRTRTRTASTIVGEAERGVHGHGRRSDESRASDRGVGLRRRPLQHGRSGRGGRERDAHPLDPLDDRSDATAMASGSMR